jgi:hypothetical protein
MVRKVETFCIFVLFAVTLTAAGAIRSFYESPGPPSLDDRTAMAIEMACDGGAFVRCRRLFCLA